MLMTCSPVMLAGPHLHQPSHLVLLLTGEACMNAIVGRLHTSCTSAVQVSSRPGCAMCLTSSMSVNSSPSTSRLEDIVCMPRCLPGCMQRAYTGSYHLFHMQAVLRAGRHLRQAPHPALLVPGGGGAHALLLLHLHAAPVREPWLVACRCCTAQGENSERFSSAVSVVVDSVSFWL